MGRANLEPTHLGDYCPGTVIKLAGKLGFEQLHQTDYHGDQPGAASGVESYPQPPPPPPPPPPPEKPLPPELLDEPAHDDY
jgi:hypothetical protein